MLEKSTPYFKDAGFFDFYLCCFGLVLLLRLWLYDSRKTSLKLFGDATDLTAVITLGAAVSQTSATWII
mgnify:CR=1 FL=1